MVFVVVRYIFSEELLQLLMYLMHLEVLDVIKKHESCQEYLTFSKKREKHFDPDLVNLFLNNIDEFLKIRNKFKDG